MADDDIPESIETRNQRRLMALAMVTCILVGAAAAWYLMHALVNVLRPLMVAVFLAYVLLPYHARLRKWFGAPLSIGLIAAVTATALLGLGFAVAFSMIELTDDIPELQGQVEQFATECELFVKEHAPWLAGSHEVPISKRFSDFAQGIVPALLSAGRDTILEAFIVALYLLFLLLGASHFPERIRKAYPHERADEILQLAGQVNAAIIGYLKAKVKSSLLLALPSGIVLFALGVKFALLWTILIFLCNFVPYVGSVIGYVLPVGFAFVQQGFVWQPITAAALLLAIQVLSATIIEPTVLGNAVGLSPLVILAALAFWGLLWGLEGMILAVPLTQVSVIVMRHFDGSRPLADLIAE